jgi:hypothetical protein
LYWRYLYEQCGGIKNGEEDPATGVQVIRHTLETLYSGEIVDINTSTSVVANFPQILDVALYQTPTCPFHSYEESLLHFTRAIYQLRNTEGRCAAHPSSECGFFDPDKVYSVPGEEDHTIVMDGKTNINGSIRSSFGVDLVKIAAGPSLEGKSIKILFKNASNPDYTYNVELWPHQAHGGAAGEPLVSKQTDPAARVIELEKLDLENLSAFDLVITRTDTHENVLEPGQYTIQVIVN